MRYATLSGILLLSAVAWADLFSPGELARAHQNISGLENCTKCHPVGGQLSQAACLECHGELLPRISKGLGFHGRIQEDKRACETCHHDHAGEAHSLIDWGPQGEKGFQHQRTGWQLKGSHSTVKCASCHEPRLLNSASIKTLILKRPHTRLGLPTECASCHFDEHRGQEKDECATCHDEKKWKVTPGFDHNKTEYALRGKHKTVKCADCHESETDSESHTFPLPKSETFMRFAPVPHKSCLDCHKDPHEGKFGKRCQSCHVVDGWQVLRNVSAERDFHEKTDFPLKGAHLDVDCKKCHGPFPGVPAKFKKLPHEKCLSCHPDAHVGQLGNAPDCSSCHDEQGFAPPKYGLQAHAKTRFPLDGAHQAVPCSACHEQKAQLRAKIPKSTLVDLKRKGREELFSLAQFDYTKPLDVCETCHQDVHKGQFKDIEKGCVSCHQASSFHKITFDHDKRSRFPLEGAHERVPCQKCHKAQPGQPVKYKPLEMSCQSCHLDVHLGQFTKAGKVDCEKCHVNEEFAPKTRFKHQPPFTEFVLDGQHAEAKCTACHRTVEVGKKVKTAQYKPLPTACEGCHADFHEGAFRGFEP